MASWKVPVSKGDGDYEKPPVGNHPAVLVAIIDMGHQWQSGYQGAAGRWQHRAYFVWELVAEKKADGRNHLIAIDLTVSVHEKAKLGKWIKARTGKSVEELEEYDIAEELGKPCLLNVIENGQYVKIDGVSAVPRGITIPAPSRTPVLMTLDEIQAKGTVTIPDWLPWFYGKPLGDQIKLAQELGGTPPNGQGGGGTTAEGKAAAAHAQEQRQATLYEPHDNSQWKCYDPEADGGLGAWAQVPASGIRDYAASKGIGFDKIRCTPADTKDIRTAAEHGFGCGHQAPF